MTDDDLTGSELRVLLERIALALEGILDTKIVIARRQQMKRGRKKNPKDNPE